MPDTYVIKDQFAPYYLTFQVVAWVDVFTRQIYRDIIVNAFNYCTQNKGLQIHAWVIMSNHIHCILSSTNGSLSDTIRDFKRHTSKQILQEAQSERESRKEWMLFQFKYAAKQHVRNEHYQVWTHENHAVEISAFIQSMSKSKIDYIHNNPVRAGWVEAPEEYMYSSAKDFAGKKGLVQLTINAFKSSNISPHHTPQKLLNNQT